MDAEPSVVNDMEAVVEHVEDAKAMRCKYRDKYEAATAHEPVTTIDFPQNIAQPHLSLTPSMCLISVSVFCIHTHLDTLQWNLIYSEAKKESTETCMQECVIFIRLKNEESPGTCMRITVAGHTKNHCDPHFGYIKRYYAKREMWILDDVKRSVKDSSPDNRCMNLERLDHTFRESTPTLKKRYRKLDGIQDIRFLKCVKMNREKYIAGNDQTARSLCRIYYSKMWRRRIPKLIQLYSGVRFTKLQHPPTKKKFMRSTRRIFSMYPPPLRNDTLYTVPDELDQKEVAAKKKGRIFMRKKELQRSS
ncbi:hypothetical protein PHMEG_00022674 [Phytophthora megakarya]|uniref:Uncharacterized protein n=1 Tax=Phytophthora megakarya TaxID=4795 RepID=A0A225VKH9_9STRA|nr:hypothetical protein PHMEG_00022674 [Phytophthora megakarya]